MLQSLFSSKTRVSLLLLFFQNPDRRYYLREINKLVAESITPIRRELLNLKRIGLLEDKRVANLVYYQINRKFLLYNELQTIVQKVVQHEDICQEDIQVSDKPMRMPGTVEEHVTVKQSCNVTLPIVQNEYESTKEQSVFKLGD